MKILTAKKGLLILFFLFEYIFALTQPEQIHLTLKFHAGNGPFEYALPAIKWNDTLIASKSYPEFKNIPSDLRDIKRGRIYFNIRQYLFQNYLEGKLSKKDFEKIKNESHIKFSDFSLAKGNIKCYVNIISAKNEKGETVCMIDANNNYDFSDDNIFIPLSDSLPDQELNRHLANVVSQRFLNGKIVNETTPLLIAKDGSALGYSIAQYATASLNIEGKRYDLAVCPLYFMSGTWNNSQIVLLTDSLKTKKAGRELIVGNGGFIKIGNNIYKFNGVDISKNLLSLQKISSNNLHSSQVGFLAPLFKSKNLLTNNDISLASYKGKYVLIDFWGTWCQPCRQQLPELVKLNNSVDSSRFVLISIASSDVLDSLKKVIAKENMIWPQIFSDKITKQYHIDAFPTTLLINPNGIVIAKDLSMDDLKEKLSNLGIL
ncbi:MAG: TlpA disulfide reductase family protein [Bacteroidota bacterium]|nr:TlpA disulfide reductase family protein [Bacteroidota bacterium]